LFSTTNSKDGFFLTSVDDNNPENADKENQPEAGQNGVEKEKPMFENINKKSKFTIKIIPLR